MKKNKTCATLHAPHPLVPSHQQTSNRILVPILILILTLLLSLLLLSLPPSPNLLNPRPLPTLPLHPILPPPLPTKPLLPTQSKEKRTYHSALLIARIHIMRHRQDARDLGVVVRALFARMIDMVEDFDEVDGPSSRWCGDEVPDLCLGCC